MNNQERDLTMKHSRDSVRKAKEWGDVAEGVSFDWWTEGREGAGFCLFREPHHTDEDIKKAKEYLMRMRDVVGKISVKYIPTISEGV